MKKFFINILLLVFAIFGFNTAVFSATVQPVKTIAVITDTGHRNGTNYLICGAASDIIATDLVNRINMTGRMKAPLLGDTMSKITQRNIPLFYMTFLNEYKYNYNIDFVNLKRVTRYIPADYLLLVTSGLDVQSNFLKDTWWNKLNIPGMDPVKPTYKLSTLITLIDKKTYQIVWQDLYLRDIEAHNYDLGIVQFSPSYAQLAKIKKYSKNMSEYVTNIIDRNVNPWIVPPEEPKAVEMKSKFVNEGTKIYYPTVNGDVVKQNFNEFKTDTHMKIEKMQQKRQQKKQIENVRRIEKQKVIEQEQQQLETKNQKLKQKEDQRLFDSIRNNIDDVTNTLPPAKETSQDYVLPAVQVTPKETQQQSTDVEIVKPNLKIQEKTTQPAVNKFQSSQKNQQKTKQINYKQKIKPNTQKQETPKQELPHYDWNIKNIYLQKIGHA